MKLFQLSLASATCLVLSASCRTTNATNEVKFSAAEHLTVGNVGYAAACGSPSICPKDLQRKDGNASFSYGELVAFSGDFYGTPEAIWEENRQRNLFSPFANDIAAAKNLFAQEAAVIEAQMKGQDAKFPDFNIKYLIAYPNYLELSANNTDHFGWHNMKAYVKYHSQALALAMEARMNPKDKKLLTKALFFNAFADHFLTDGFAAGHLRIPRSQGIQWGTKNSVRPEAVGALAKVLHDNDHPFERDGGILVSNARGDNWKTRSDSDLYLGSNDDNKAVLMVQEALTQSVKEVLDVYQGQEIPKGVFRATELVPFVAKETRSLADDFPPSMSEDEVRTKYLEGLGIIWTTRAITGLSAKLAIDYFAALPTQMTEFRMMVRADALDPELSRRLPKAYVDGFLKVH